MTKDQISRRILLAQKHSQTPLGINPVAYGDFLCGYDAAESEDKIARKQLSECMEFLVWLNEYENKSELVNVRLKSLFLSLSLLGDKNEQTNDR